MKHLHANPVKGIRVLKAYTLPDGVKYLEIRCRDYKHLTQLPEIVELNNRIYSRTGWDSDHCVACYKVGGLIAHALK